MADKKKKKAKRPPLTTRVKRGLQRHIANVGRLRRRITG